MSLIQTSVIARKLQQFLRLTELPDSLLAPDVVAVIVVEDLSDPLTGDARGGVGVTRQNAVVAENSMVALTRVSNQYRLTLNKIFINTDTAQLISVIAASPPLTGMTPSINTSFTDMKTPGRPSSILSLDSKVAVPPGRQLWRSRILASTPVTVEIALDVGAPDDELPLTDVVVVGEALNTALTVGFAWTESPPLG